MEASVGIIAGYWMALAKPVVLTSDPPKVAVCEKNGIDKAGSKVSSENYL